MNTLPNFNGIEEHFMQNADMYKSVYDSNTPHTMTIPSPWEEKLDEFEKIIFLKFIRSDKVIPAI
jgi:dynein heavy chain